MLRYTLKRLGSTLPTLIAVLTVIFVIIRIAPGDPAIAILGDNASQQAIDATDRYVALSSVMTAPVQTVDERDSLRGTAIILSRARRAPSASSGWRKSTASCRSKPASATTS